ncbi:MAG: carboxypeptidase regulatory-like domain-containing protein [Terracidiphilus sp.]
MQIPASRVSGTSQMGIPNVPSQLKTTWLGLQTAVLLAALACFLVSSLHAQYNASLRGVVADPSGAVIPGATVSLVDTATNYTQTVTSNEVGIYTFNALPPAPYRLTVSKGGFKTKVLEQVEIIPEQANLLNLQLEVSATPETVTVTATTYGLPTETATLSATISSNEIQHMPSFNRDVFQLAQLTPGVFGNGAQGSGGGSFNNPGNQGPGGSGGGQAGIFQTENGPQVQDRGGQYETNSITVDGISTVSAVWGGTSVITPSEDSVEDMHVVANSYDAENGRFTGADMEITSKSGTNNVHGSFFFKMARPGLNAYQRWNGTGSNKSGTAAERGVNLYDARFNNLGGSLGGPFWKNKLFGFFNIEASPLSSSTTSQGWYETSQFDSSAGTGPIAKEYLSFKGEGVASGATMIARTCASIGLTEGVNCITLSNGLDVGSPLTSGVGYQDLTYGGNSGIPGVGGGLNPSNPLPALAYFNTVDPTSTSQFQYNGRLDADVTKKDRVTFALYWVPVSTTDYNGPVRSANLWHHSQTNDAFSLIWNHTFSATLLNQARANAAGWRWNEVATNSQEPFGLPQDNIGSIGTASPNFFGAPGPSDFDQWTYSYNDVLTKILGRHSIKTGGDVTRLYYLNDAIYAARPGFNFDNLWDFANDAPYFESGTFNHSTGVPFSNREDTRDGVWGFFVQDDYKLRPSLTINAGIRWSYFSPYYSKESNLDVMQFGSGSDPLTGLNIRVGGNLATAQKGNWGPQLGFSWQPPILQGKAVLRGGYGINFNQNEIAILANGFGNPPNAISASFTCPYPYTSNPTCSGTGILYETATSTTSIFGYAPNPATITTFSSANLPLTGTTSVTGFPANTKTIANYHYSLEADYQLPFSTMATLGYQGSEMRHLLVQNEWNAIAAQKGLALNPVVNFIDFYENSGTGNYNALVATLGHSFAQHFQAEAQYTWGKAMDENSGPYEEDPYPYNTHAAYGRSDYNVKSAFKLFGLWQPVFFSGHSWAEKYIGGWSLSGIWNLDTGFPWNPTYGTSGIYYQGSAYGSVRPAGHVAGAGTSTANKTFEGIGGINSNYGGNGTKFLTPPTYTLGPAFPATAPGPPPGIQRNSLNGPGYNDFDASLTKDFGLPMPPNNRILGENANLSFRVDSYNLFNKTNINTGCMDTYLGSAAPDGTVTSVNSDFGVSCGSLGSRTVQMQVRFNF